MHLIDATRSFGRVGLLLPLTLIFLTAVDSAFACPGNKTKVAYRTSAINTRTVSYRPATVITYRAPVSYRRCGASMYDTRGTRYVSVRSNEYRNGSSARYVAVRNDNGYQKLRRARYTAVRDVDYDEAPRYVAIRHRYPVYRLSDNRYAEIRSGYRRNNGVVRYIDIDDAEPRVVAVRRVVPQTRYVAVRNIDIDDYDEPRYVVRRVAPRTRYVAVRNIDNGCTRAVALRSCLDQVETTSARRVVLRDDDGYSVRTKHVVLRDDLDDDEEIIENDIDVDDDEYISVVNDTPKYIEYTPAAYSSGNSATYIAANDFDNTCVRNVAVRTCRPDAVSTRTITYEVSDDNDLDDQAFLDDGDVTYVADVDTEDACLPRQVVGTSPRFVTTRAVNYAPAEYVVEDASPVGSETTYVEAGDDAAVPWPRYVALDEDRVFDDLDPTWVAEVEDICERKSAHCNLPDQVAAGRVNFVPLDDVVEPHTATVSYVPVDDVEEIDTATVAYAPVDDVREIDATTVSYVPVADTNVTPVRYVTFDDTDVETVSYVPVRNTAVKAASYVPVDSIDEVDTTYVAADDCPMFVSSVDAKPVYVADASTVLVEEVDDDLVAGLRGTRQIASGFGYRDGFEDGQEAALEGDLYHPENAGDYQKATEGYEDDFGDKDVYKDAYRSSYLAGYRAGFKSGKSV